MAVNFNHCYIVYGNGRFLFCWHLKYTCYKYEGSHIPLLEYPVVVPRWPTI